MKMAASWAGVRRREGVLRRRAWSAKRPQVSSLKGTRRRTVQDGSVGRPPRETRRLVIIGNIAISPIGPKERRPRGITTDAPSASEIRSTRATWVSRTFFFVERADATINPRYDDSDLALPGMAPEVMQESSQERSPPVKIPPRREGHDHHGLFEHEPTSLSVIAPDALSPRKGRRSAEQTTEQVQERPHPTRLANRPPLEIPFGNEHGDFFRSERARRAQKSVPSLPRHRVPFLYQKSRPST